MISYLKGELTAKKDDYFILEAGGIGYKIYAASPMIFRLPEKGSDIKVFTYLAVREDFLGLYGFLTQEELAVFEMLLTVSRIGPKLASAIAGSLEPSVFALAVLSSDTSTLTSVKGLGKKGAEKIVIELRDKIKKSSLPIGEGGVNITSDLDPLDSGIDDKFNQAASALVVLGYSAIQARQAITPVYDDDKSLEEIIKLALKELA